MPREQPQQLLSGVAGRAGDGDSRRAGRGRIAVRCPIRGNPSMADGMHRKEYLYTSEQVRSTTIDVYSFVILMKARRQAAILELIDREPFHSQDGLRRRLRQRGFDATQATISRDIRDLGLVKRAGDGAYQRPGVDTADPETARTALERAAAEFLRRVDRVQQLVVIRTGIGQAQPLAIALDRAQLAEAVGTIAGDDTILVVARGARAAAALVKRLKDYTAE